MNSEKARKLLDALDPIDSQLEEALKLAAKQLKETISSRTAEQANEKFKKLNKIFQDITKSVEELKGSVEKRDKTLIGQLQKSLERLNTDLKSIQNTNASEASFFTQEIERVKEQIAEVSSREFPKIPDFIKPMKEMESSLLEIISLENANRAEDYETQKKELEKIADSVDKKLNTLRGQLMNHGGGNANRQILVNSSVMSQAYTDINLLGDITAANDNTNKRVDITFASTPPEIGGEIIGGTEGSVLFVGAGSVFAQDNSNLFWDDSSNELGVGTNSPTGKLHVNGTLGSNVIVNGTFATDSDWSKGAGWTITGGQAVATATTANLTQSPSTTATRTFYKITHTSTVTSGTYRIIVGGQTLNTISASGTYTTYVWTTSTGGLAFDGVTSFTGTIDNVSMYEITDTQVLDNAFFSSTIAPVVFMANQDTNNAAAVFIRDTGTAAGAMPNIGMGTGEPVLSTGFQGLHMLGGENQSVEIKLDTTDTNRTTQILFSNAKTDKWIIKNTATSNKFSILDCADNNAGIFNIVTNGFIGINEADPLAALEVNAESAADVVMIAQGTASQTGDLQQWQDSNANILLNVEDGLTPTNPILVSAYTNTITGAVTDGYVGAYRATPTYTAATALTVTRHNYFDLNDVAVAGAGPAAVTDAAVMRFNAAAGTHKATVGATTKTTPGTVDAWVKININGTLYYLPAYTSTTS